MSAQLGMFSPATSLDIASTISSPESESGVIASASQGGQTTGQYGPHHAPVSRFPSPENARGPQMSATYGQCSLLWPDGSALSYSLASKWRKLTASAGSTMYAMTWKNAVTPRGRSLPRLAARARHTSENGCTGWPTPAKTEPGPSSGQVSISREALLAGWSSPRAMDANSANYMYDRGDKTKVTLMLGGQADLAGWSTPRATDGSNGGPNQAGGALPADAAMAGWATPQSRDHFPAHSPERIAAKLEAGHGMADLSDQAMLAGWATPKASDAEGGQTTATEGGGNAHLQIQARLAAWPPEDAGPGPIGYLLGRNGLGIVHCGGPLNAAHSRFLIGLPPEWCECAIRAFRSLKAKKRARSGSKATETAS